MPISRKRRGTRSCRLDGRRPSWKGHVYMKWIVAAFSVLCCTVSAVAQDYPNRPVTMVVPFVAGGPGDIIGRRRESVNAQGHVERLGYPHTLGESCFVQS